LSCSNDAVAGAPELSNDEFSKFDKKGIFFEYPASWLKAYDRTDTAKTGGLVLVGDFKNVDTISVACAEVPDELRGMEDGSLDAREAAEFLLREPLASSSTMSLGILDSSTTSSAHGPRPAYRTEFTLEVCRGEVEEASGGKKTCLGPRGAELQTVQRHHVTISAVRDGLLYTLSASAEEPRWPAVGDALQAAADSFVLS